MSANPLLQGFNKFILKKEEINSFDNKKIAYIFGKKLVNYAQ
jgi:hypothetical protein